MAAANPSGSGGSGASTRADVGDEFGEGGGMLGLEPNEGYSIMDSMYYVKKKGRGMAGMELIDGMGKLEEMVNLNEAKKCVEITVVKDRTALPSDTNINSVEEQVPIDEIGDYFVTRQSNNVAKGKEILHSDCDDFDMGEDPDVEFQYGNNYNSEDDDDWELSQELSNLKRKRKSCEEDDLFYASDKEEDENRASSSTAVDSTSSVTAPAAGTNAAHASSSAASRPTARTSATPQAAPAAPPPSAPATQGAPSAAATSKPTTTKAAAASAPQPRAASARAGFIAPRAATPGASVRPTRKK
ncbi:hypothetical protein ACQ4PT_028972 [Festuca glaucescens]